MAAKKSSVLYALIQQYSQHPRLFYTATDDDLEHAHFTSWCCNALLLQTYASPVINDLYYLHELVHLASMPYAENIGFEEWSAKMLENELYASLFSEVLIYFHLPELRAVAFPEEIWADRFLRDEARLLPPRANRDAFRTCYDAFFAALVQARRAITHRTARNRIELVIANYAASNSLWFEIWRENYRIVENFISNWKTSCSVIGKEKSGLNLKRWVEDLTRVGNGIPFRNEAVAFKRVSANIKLRMSQAPPTINSNATNSNSCALTSPSASPRDLALHFGATPTVYSLVLPETTRVLDAMWRQPDALHTLYESAYLQKQDQLHVSFFNAFTDWALPVVNIPAEFAYRYPTAGSSEAIRQSLAMVKVTNPRATVHVFEGEYEGYQALARSFDLTVATHTRADYARTLRPGAGDAFYLSQPSSIDGNVWTGCDAFLTWCSRCNPGLDVKLDLAYLGTVSSPFTINVDYPVISELFISLSKAFGVYYHRIGGVYSRKANASLYGNVWFKNLFSLRFGEKLLRSYSVFELPRKYRPLQEFLIPRLGVELNLNLKCSDVVLLGNFESRNDSQCFDDLTQRMKRTCARDEDANTYVLQGRVCLTPGMDLVLRNLPSFREFYAPMKNVAMLREEEQKDLDRLVRESQSDFLATLFRDMRHRQTYLFGPRKAKL